MNVLLVDQGDVHGGAVFSDQVLNMILLNLSGLFHDALVLIGNLILEEAVPLLVGETELIESFQLAAKVLNQSRFIVDGDILIALLGQHPDKSGFQRRFALIGIGTLGLGLIFCDNGTFVGGHHDIKITHASSPLLALCALSEELIHAALKLSSLSR